MTARRAAAALARAGFLVRRPAIATSMTAEEFRLTEPEASFMAWVIGFAELHGWLVHHTLNSIGSEEGDPDLHMVRNGRLIFAELKRVGGWASYPQRLWLGELCVVPGVEVHLWDPTDRAEIEAILARGMPGVSVSDPGRQRTGGSNAR